MYFWNLGELGDHGRTHAVGYVVDDVEVLIAKGLDFRFSQSVGFEEAVGIIRLEMEIEFVLVIEQNFVNVGVALRDGHTHLTHHEGNMGMGMFHTDHVYEGRSLQHIAHACGLENQDAFGRGCVHR